jgi:hypothetical protein
MRNFDQFGSSSGGGQVSQSELSLIEAFCYLVGQDPQGVGWGEGGVWLAQLKRMKMSMKSSSLPPIWLFPRGGGANRSKWRFLIDNFIFFSWASPRHQQATNLVKVGVSVQFKWFVFIEPTNMF